uniref:Portal protein n=1 Tax=viral metagenome TaxID=1070528 RepID=A0A6H1ZW68_9ZZZZ
MLVDDYTLSAYKPNQKPSKSDQKFIDILAKRLENVDENTTGFSVPMALSDIILQMGRNILTSDNASAALFIQLNDDYTVDRFNALDCDRVFFETPYGSNREIPYIYDNGRKVMLDCINFLWQPLDVNAEEIEGNNPLRPGIRTSFTKMEFLESLRKVLKNQAWPKVKVVLDEKAVINSAPAEVRQDPEMLIDYLNKYMKIVEEQFTGIEPDQNLIFYDTVKEIGFLESSQRFDPTPIAKLIESELISSYKAPPSTVGQGGSTRTGEGLASAELVIFRRSIKAYRKVIERVLSRAFTLAMRLDGRQGYAVFELNEFSLRPPMENAQFESIVQDNTIQAWESGSIGDKEKDRKIRKMQGLQGDAPDDASVKPFSGKSNKQTDRTAVTNESKEKKREETRKNQKTGNDKK